MKPGLREALSQNVMIGDGAMGTFLYQLGFPVGISYEELNLSKPDVIANVHRRYYDAGARIIETNTFSANREKLSKFGLEHEVEAINRQGVAIARQAVGADAYVIGAVGSIRDGKRKNIRTTQIKRDFQQQIDILLAEPIDGLVLETFYDLEEILIVLKMIRKQSQIPVICQFATEDVGRTLDGFTMSEAFERLIQEGADVIGFNCRTGPNGIIRTMENILPLGETPISVFPNAGIPDYVDGRYTYMATPEYFAESALKFADLGARIIGGCCGTTPDHIVAMARALKDYRLQDRAPLPQQDESNEREEIMAAEITVVDKLQEAQVKRNDEPQQLSIVDLVKKRHTVIVELDPPRDLDIERFMKGAAALKAAGVDAITMADNSLAVTRMSNMALGHLVKERIGIRPLVHITCRDRNLIGTQSHLMGLDALGMDHVLAVTGDPAKFGDLPGSSSVYDLTSFEIIRMIKQLNDGIAFSGKSLQQKAKFVVAAAFNPNVKYLDKAVKRLERKIESGADFIMTQPVYDPKLIEDVYEATKHLGVPVFIGLFPLASGGNAEYLHNEVPGIQLSDEVRQRMAGLKGAEGRAMGVQITKELLDVAVNYFQGIYLMTPFLSYEMTVQLAEYVWEITNQRDYHLYPLSK